MAILNPPAGINLNAALGAAGLGPKSTGDATSIKDIFTQNGAGIEDIARTTGSLMVSADTDGVRLQATRFAAEVQRIIDREVKTSDAPQINIAIVSSSPESANSLIAVLMPKMGALES